MSANRRISLALLATLPLAGCVQRPPAVTATPHHGELPELPYLEPVLPATVAVEGRREAPRARLTPDLEPPPLTAEEKAALGEREIIISILKYPLPTRTPGSPVGPYFGGVTTAAHGQAGAAVGLVPFGPRVGTAGHAGVTSGAYPVPASIAGLTPPRAPISGQAGEVSVQVGTDRAKRIAGRKPRIER